MKQESIYSLLESAVHKPSAVGSPCGALALAMHCLMVRAGFNAEDEGQRKRHSSYQPPSDWKQLGLQEFQFVYTRSGKLNKFKLIVSQADEKHGRIFVHASEASTENIQILGLQLENYIPDASSIKTSNKWGDILVNEGALVGYFQQYIMDPLLENSEDDSPPAAYVSSSPKPSQEEAGAADARRLPRISSASCCSLLTSLCPAYAAKDTSTVLLGAGIGAVAIGAAAVVALLLMRRQSA